MVIATPVRCDSCKHLCSISASISTHRHAWVPVPVSLVGASSASSDGGGTVNQLKAGWGQAQGNTCGTSVLGLPAVGAGSAAVHCSLLVLVGVQGALDGICGVGGVNVVALERQGACSSGGAALSGGGDAIRAGDAVGVGVQRGGVRALLAQLADALVHVGASRGLCRSKAAAAAARKSGDALQQPTVLLPHTMFMHDCAT